MMSLFLVVQRTRESKIKADSMTESPISGSEMLFLACIWGSYMLVETRGLSGDTFVILLITTHKGPANHLPKVSPLKISH
jgi:hypothetical protein